MEFTSEGLLTGTPEEPGEYVLDANVIDECDPEPQTAQRIYSFVVDATAGCEDVIFETTQLPDADFGVFYQQEITVSGGVESYNFTLEPGSQLPTGLILTADGILQGTPNNDNEIGQTFNFVVRVTDSCEAPGGPATATQLFRITLINE